LADLVQVLMEQELDKGQEENQEQGELQVDQVVWEVQKKVLV
jgi:hypothetical protein